DKESWAVPAPPSTPFKVRPLILLALPGATLVALAVHFLVSKNEPRADTASYTILLAILLGLSVAAVGGQALWPGLRRRLAHMIPIFAAAVMALCLWEGVTSGLRLLPLPYFPSPASVLQSLINDRALLFDSTWHSLLLLLSGYLIGAVIALITGICIGWFPYARYWGMPVLKVVGPIPATAWVPLAMV